MSLQNRWSRDSSPISPILLTLLTVLLPSCQVAGAPPPASEAQSCGIDVALARSAELGLPGTVIVASGADGVVHAAAAGVANRVTGAALTAEHLFHIASVSKLFAAVAVLELVDADELSLDDRLLDHVDGKRLSGLPWAEEITIRQLLDHSAGTYATNNDMEYIRHWMGERAGEAANWTGDDFVALAARNEPLARPGDDVFYSDTNYVLLAMVIESVTARPYRAHLAESLFAPLALSSAGFFTGDTRSPQATRGYLWLSDDLAGLVAADHFEAVGEQWLDTTSAGERIDGAASIVMNGLDLHRFAEAVFRGELLSASSRAWLFSVADQLDLDPGANRLQGTLVAHRRHGRILLAAAGDGPGGVHTLVAYDPVADQLLVALTNSFGRGPESDFLLDTAHPNLTAGCPGAPGS